MGNLVFVEKILNLISEINKYIKSNEDLVFYFLNPLHETDINMCYKYFPSEFLSYEDYIKYLKEKGLAIEAV